MALHSYSSASASFSAPRRKSASPEDINQYRKLMNEEHSRDQFYCVICQKNICSLYLLSLSYASHYPKELCPQCKPWLQGGGGGILVVPLTLSMSSHISISVDLQISMLNDN